MQRNTVVGLTSGLHARPAALLVQEVKKFSSEIFIQHGSKKVNARSIMGLMSLALTKGAGITIIAEGEDEEAALGALEQFLSKDLST